MLYWLKRYDEQNNNTMTIEIFKSYISNEKTGGSDGGARPLPASTGRHVAEPSPAGGGRKKMGVVTRRPLHAVEGSPTGGRHKKMGVVTEAYVHCLSAHADAWPSPRLRDRRKKMGIVKEAPAHCPSAHADAWPSLRLREVDAR